MEQIKNFTIHGFRGLRELKIEDLGQINLFVGNNNSGKTSVLEAISIFCDPFNWRRWSEAGSQREGLLNTSLRSDRIAWLFPQWANDNETLPSNTAKIAFSAQGKFPLAEVSASYEKFTEIVTTQVPVGKLDEAAIEDREFEAEGLKLHISVLPKHEQLTLFGDDEPIEETLTFTEPFFSPPVSKKRISTLPVRTVNPLMHRSSALSPRLWSDVVEADLKSETTELLRFFDPGIQDVDIISPTERRQLVSIKHAKLGRAPLQTFGDGLRRVFTLATSIAQAKGGLLLVDELEIAIHTRALKKTFDWLVKACIRNDIQLLATTHSLEALDAILAVSHNDVDLVAYRLQQTDEQTVAIRLAKDIILRLREELGVEVRY